MQELVNAVRGVGATNLILLGGLSYSNSLAQFNQYVPKDPQNNTAAAWHSYNFNKCNNEGCWNQYILPTVKKYPLITTEIGEDDCAGGYVTAVMKWLDANAGGNYLAWTFNTWDCREGPALISSYDNNGTPTPYGAAIKKHYASFNTHSTAKPNKNSGKKNSKKHHEPSPGGGKLGGGEQPAPGGRGFSSGGGGGGSLTGSPTPAGKHKHGKHNKDGGTKKSKQSPSGSGALTGQPKFNKSTEKHKHGKHNKNHNVVKTHGKSPKQELANKHSKQGVKNKPPKHGSGHGMKNKKPTNTKHTGSEAHHNSKHSTQPDKKTKKRHSKKQGNKKSKHSKGR